MHTAARIFFLYFLNTHDAKYYRIYEQQIEISPIWALCCGCG